MIWKGLLITIVFSFPLAAKRIAKHPALKGWLSPVVICYALGIALGNLPLIPIDRGLARTISEVNILFAIPLLLYNTHLLHWLRYANKTLLSFALCAVSGFIASGTMGYLFRTKISEVWIVSGMVAGLYTGGTPNMQGVGFALRAPESVIVLVNAADIFTGGLYLIFLTSAAPRVFGFFLPAFQAGSTYISLQPEKTSIEFSWEDSLRSVLLTVSIIGIALGLTWLVFGNLEQSIFILLLLTTLSIGASFVPTIRRRRSAFDTGEYFLLAFCIAIGALANFREIINEGQQVVGFVSGVLLLTVALHLLLARWFGIDRDTMLLTSTAGLYGPAFVGQIATVIGNRELVFSGISMGLLGYAIGNYWGIGLAYLLRILLG